ncbi:MAG: glycosyltransferase family 39 protein [Desulfobacterales bacterium]|jgi:dolichol-phosphate mannosyltransferase
MQIASRDNRAVGIVSVGSIADLLLFYIFIHIGTPWNSAHVISFLSGAIVTCVLWLIWLQATALAQSGIRLFSTWIVIELFALFLRGGVLSALVEVGGWSPTTAIIWGVGVSSAVMLFSTHQWILPSDKSRMDPDNRWLSFSITLIGYAVILRILYSGSVELLHEEAYYWNYAQHLDIGYLDHPPMVGWLIWVFTTFLGHSEIAVRTGALVCWLVTAFYAYRLAYALDGLRMALGTLLFVALLPFFFSVGLIMIPDAPLVACWAGSLYYLYRSLIEERSAAWVGVGIFMGLGLLSKYTMVLLGIAAFMFMLADRRSRHWFLRLEPYLSVLIAALLFAPVLFWNADHQWVSFFFQGPKRFSGRFDFDLPDLIGCMLVLLTPTGFLAAVATVVSRKSLFSDAVDTRNRRACRLLLTLTVIPLSVFVFFSLFRNIKLNWTGPIWLGILPYIAAFTLPHCRASDSKMAGFAMRAWPATLVAILLLYGATLHFAALGFPATPYPPNPFGMGMQHLAQEIEIVVNDFERRTRETPLIVCMDGDRLAGWVAFYRTKNAGLQNEFERAKIVGNTTGGHFFGKNSHMYRIWHPIGTHQNRVILLIGRKRSGFADEIVQSRAKPIGDIEEVVFQKNGKVAGRFFYRFLRVDDSSSFLKNSK